MNKEILMAVDAVSNEKGVDKEIIFEALEAALASATRKKHGEELDVRVSINRKTGGYDTFRRWKVFADDSTELEVPERELRLDDARDIDKDVEPGGYVEQPMESVPFGRILAQTAKQVIVQKVREAERAQVVDAYKDRAGTLVSGIVKRVDRNGVYVDLGANAEGFIAREEMIPREPVRSQDRIKAYLKEVRTEPRGPQLFLSRTAPEFLIGNNKKKQTNYKKIRKISNLICKSLPSLLYTLCSFCLIITIKSLVSPVILSLPKSLYTILSSSFIVFFNSITIGLLSIINFCPLHNLHLFFSSINSFIPLHLEQGCSIIQNPLFIGILVLADPVPLQVLQILTLYPPFPLHSVHIIFLCITISNFDSLYIDSKSTFTVRSNGLYILDVNMLLTLSCTFCFNASSPHISYICLASSLLSTLYAFEINLNCSPSFVGSLSG